MHPPNFHANRGFTLVELMITVGIAAILASIAIPAYTSYIQKGRRADAKSALLNMAAMQERLYSTTNAYSQVPTDFGYAGATFGTGVLVGSGYYTVNVTSVTAATATVPAAYTIQANAVNTQTNDTACQIFQINSLGQQVAYDSSSALNTATCWK